MKYIICTIFIIIMTGCSSVQQKNYIENLPNEAPIFTLSHEKYGELRTNEEPLKDISKQCISESFNGKEIVISGVLISDPEKLMNIVYDYNSHLLAIVQPQRFSRNSFFESEDIKHQIRKLTKANDARVACLKNRGWS